MPAENKTNQRCYEIGLMVFHGNEGVFIQILDFFSSSSPMIVLHVPGLLDLLLAIENINLS